MFSPFTPSMFALARLFTPMMPRFSLSFGDCLRHEAGSVPAQTERAAKTPSSPAPVRRRKSRRVIWERMGTPPSYDFVIPTSYSNQLQNFIHRSRNFQQMFFAAAVHFGRRPLVVTDFGAGFQNFRPVFAAFADWHPAFVFAVRGLFAAVA